MPKLIKNGQVLNDKWKVLTLGLSSSAQDVKLPVGPVIVPLSVWNLRRRELFHREYEHGWPLGVWLAANENPQKIENEIDDLSVIAIRFDKFSDGNSYLTPRLLRERYGYEGELRAIGDVPHDKFAYLQQIGFDAIELSASRQVGGALFSLFDSSFISSESKLLAA